MARHIPPRPATGYNLVSDERLDDLIKRQMPPPPHNGKETCARQWDIYNALRELRERRMTIAQTSSKEAS
jgi:hypothetical protein